MIDLVGCFRHDPLARLMLDGTRELVSLLADLRPDLHDACVEQTARVTALRTGPRPLLELREQPRQCGLAVGFAPFGAYRILRTHPREEATRAARVAARALGI